MCFIMSYSTNKHGIDIIYIISASKQDRLSDYHSWRQEVNIATGIYLPPILALLSDLVLVATKLLAYTGNLLQSLGHRERRQRYNEICWKSFYWSTVQIKLKLRIMYLKKPKNDKD